VADTRLLNDAAAEALALLQWMIPEPGQFRQPTDEIYARALATIANATAAAGATPPSHTRIAGVKIKAVPADYTAGVDVHGEGKKE
jgi:hypothetical protein